MPNDYFARMRRLKAQYPFLILGVTGGIATGKSAVSRMLEELGAPLIDFDRLARQVVAPGSPALDRIVERFGPLVLQEDGSLNRKHLSEIVFADPEKRKELERITHPVIFDAFFHSLEAMVRSRPNAVVQADLPLLMELNLQPLFDMVVLVYAGADHQIERLCRRESISRDEALAMISSQMPIDKKLGLAHRVIRNDGSLEETQRQVEAFWADLAHLRRPHGA